MNKLLVPAFGALAFAFAAATPANADTLASEVRFIDVDDGSDQATEYAGSYTHNFYILRNGLEASHVVGSTNDNTKLSTNLSVDIQAPAGVVLSPKVELGYVFNEGKKDSGAFWGVALNAERDFGPFTALAGVRHREGFDDLILGDEDRYNLGVRLNLTDSQSIGATYYATDANVDSTAVAVSYRLAFN